jgi:branched-chain amino acid transport system permease protein
VRSPFGRVLVALRENEERTQLLGYDTYRLRLVAVLASGFISGLAGVTYTLLFGYVGSTFAGVLYSIYPLLWTLLGGAGTTLGPLVGTLLMTYAVDVASGITDAYLIVVGAVLIAEVLWVPAGVVGGIRARWARWLP